MKSITIHNLDSETSKLIEEKSKEVGLSLNKTIKMLLHKALGVSGEVMDNKTGFKEFFGVWNEEQFREFEEVIKDFDN